MALSSKRPSQRDEVKTRLLSDVTETNERKRRLNAEIEDFSIAGSRDELRKRGKQYPALPATYGLSI